MARVKTMKEKLNKKFRNKIGQYDLEDHAMLPLVS
jgi:hypothetical protein